VGSRSELDRAAPWRHKKAGCSLQSQPGWRIHLDVAGLGPSRRTTVMAQPFGPIHELTGALTLGTGGTVGSLIKNRGRRAPAFPGGVADSEARPSPHPTEETTNEPRPGLAAPRASHQSDPEPLAQGCVSRVVVLGRPSQTSDDNDRTARVGALIHPKEITNPSAGMRAWPTPSRDLKQQTRSGASRSPVAAVLDPPHCARGWTSGSSRPPVPPSRSLRQSARAVRSPSLHCPAFSQQGCPLHRRGLEIQLALQFQAKGRCQHHRDYAHSLTKLESPFGLAKNTAGHARPLILSLV